MNALELIGCLALTLAAWALLNHSLSPMPLYERLYRWSAARIAARRTFEAHMAVTVSDNGREYQIQERV